MTQGNVSLLGVASYLPERVVTNEFFAPGASQRRGMFTAPTTRRHVGPDESAAEMIQHASALLFERLALSAANDVDILFTNVAVPDQAFTGCGAEVAHRIGARPRWIIDLHNTGCVAFIYMMDLARTLLRAHGARGALLCNVQNSAGRIFSDPDVRRKSQAPVPGDGCGVGYVTLSDVSPIVSVVQHCQPEFASDMLACADDGRRYWEPGASPLSIRFTDARVASIIERGNRIVPQVVTEACREAGLQPNDIGLLITNQPNPIFLRNWREALELPKDHGNRTAVAVDHDQATRVTIPHLVGGLLQCFVGKAGVYGVRHQVFDPRRSLQEGSGSNTAIGVPTDLLVVRRATAAHFCTRRARFAPGPGVRL